MTAKFIESKQKDDPGLATWFNDCERTGRPYVVVSRRGSVAKVKWDGIAFPESLRRKSADTLMAGFHRLLEKYGGKGSGLLGGEGYMVFSRIDGDRAAAMAEELHDFVAATLDGSV